MKPRNAKRARPAEQALCLRVSRPVRSSWHHRQASSSCARGDRSTRRPPRDDRTRSDARGQHADAIAEREGFAHVVRDMITVLRSRSWMRRKLAMQLRTREGSKRAKGASSAGSADRPQARARRRRVAAGRPRAVGPPRREMALAARRDRAARARANRRAPSSTARAAAPRPRVATDMCGKRPTSCRTKPTRRRS